MQNENFPHIYVLLNIFQKSVEYVKWCSLLLPMAGHKTGHVFKNNWKIKIRLSSGRDNSDSKLNKPLILMFVLWWWKMEMYNHWLFMYRCCLCYGIQNIYVAFQANVKCKKDSLLLWHLLLLFFKKNWTPYGHISFKKSAKSA